MDQDQELSIRKSQSIVTAQLVEGPHVWATPIEGSPRSMSANGRVGRSWPFRIIDGTIWLGSSLFGIVSLVFLLAVAANIPLVQFLSLGYLLEVTGRLARGDRWRDAMIGLAKAARIGAVVLGTWLLLLPIRLVSLIWLEAHLIDPTSPQTQFMRLTQVLLIVLTIAHIISVWICGGKLRYFFWPVVAPFSFGIWFLRRCAGSPAFRRILNLTVGWLSPSLVDDICAAQPITDWFVPAILWQRRRSLYRDARDGLWDFVSSLNLPYFFWLGLKGFLGSFAWLLLPTLLLVASTTSDNDAVAIAFGLLGTAIAIPVFAALPFLQAHFATDGKFVRFFQLLPVARIFVRAPVTHLLALLVTLLFALPLFLLKIEEIPPELLWTLSLVFVVFTWPARMVVGAAYRRGAHRREPSRWWIQYPAVLFALALATPISLTFVVILFFTRYVTWHGAWSLFENHVFLLPAPFWLSL